MLNVQDVAFAILAGGMGTRLYGEAGGSKALSSIGDWHLIDYVLSEAKASEMAPPTVIIRENDSALAKYVAGIGGITISPPSRGTGPAVAALLEACDGRPTVLLSTCDLWGPPGAISNFISQSLTMIENHPTLAPVCILAVEPPPVDDDTPIWVESVDGIVRRYGKNLDATGLAFAGVRLLNSAFSQLWLQVYAGNNKDGTDTTTTLNAHMK